MQGTGADLSCGGDVLGTVVGVAVVVCVGKDVWGEYNR